MNEPYRKDGLHISFDPKSPTRTISIAIDGKSVTLDAEESNNLLEWLYQKRDTLFQYEIVQQLAQKKG